VLGKGNGGVEVCGRVLCRPPRAYGTRGEGGMTTTNDGFAHG
jgi:hypothetical protein